MALARSASGPGGLSINTGAANLFGSATTQPAATGGLFGAAATTTAQPATGGLFGTPATTSAATTTAAAPATTMATSSLFGGGGAATGGGLFGQAAKPAGSSLFGGGPATTTAAAAPASGTSLFGSSTAAPAATQSSTGLGGGLFGGSTAQAPATTQGGLFGTQQPQQQQPQQQTNSLFQSQQAQPQQQQQQQVIPGVRIDLSNLKGTTRFNDLQESLQKDIIAFDSLIQSYIEQKNQVEAFLPAHTESLEAIPGDVRFVARKYDGVSAAMASDLQSIQALRETVKQDAEHAQLSFKALDNQKLPSQFHTSGLWSGAGGPAAKKSGVRSRERDNRDGVDGGSGGSNGENGRTDLINYFSHTGDEIGAQLRKLESNLGEIEVHMYSVQAGLLEQLQRVAASSSSSARSANGASSSGAAGAGADGGSSADSKVAELAAVLRDFEESILTVASVVGSARESMTGLQLGDFLGRGR